ncbi:MAG TPA: hypothetical protein VFP68_18565, partial [Burkholderiaceae bacterium]|nr:hypothetical protein [Burkholderiaceae bacterium]
DRQCGARLLRRFTRTLLDGNPSATLRDFLRRFDSQDADERQKAYEELSNFDNREWARTRLNDALNTLVQHGYDDLHLGVAEFELFGRSGTIPRTLLPPDDQSLLEVLDKDARTRNVPGGTVDMTNTSAVTRFAVALLEGGIGGLADWLSLLREDSSPQDKAEAKVLLDSFRSTLPRGSSASGRIFIALRRLQEFAGVDRGYRIKRNRRASGFPPFPPTDRRQPGEGTSAGTMHLGGRVAEEPMPLDFGHVPRRPRTARALIVDQPRDDVLAGPASPLDDMVPLHPEIKQEPGDADRPTRAPVYVEAEMLDQARTAFYRELELCDLSGDMAEWHLYLNLNDATVVRHRPAPIPENDHKFPLRDPADPLRRVHRRYAGPDGKCDPKVQIRDVRLGNGFRSYFRALTKTDARLRIDRDALPSLIGQLEDDARRELERLIHETPRPARCQPRLLQKDDVMAHEQTLVGQYGLFVGRPAIGYELPTLSNGRILGFYMGALVDNDDDLARTVSDHPDYELYAVDTAAPRGWVTYSGKAATNSLAFANTALKPDAGEPAYDTDRINAIFIDFSVGLFDNQGKPSRESLVAMVALDNLFDDSRDEAQVLVDYGDAFLQHFKQESGPGEPSLPRAMKAEQELEQQPQQSATTSR